MKTIKKILPIFATLGVASIPLATASCSNVWIDMLEKQYQPTFEPYKTTDGSGEVTSVEAMKKYKEHFLNNKNDLIPDFYWGTSFFAKNGLPSSTREVLTFLNHIDNMNIEPAGEQATMSAPLLSYHSKVQMEIKNHGISKSYAVNTYDLDWEFNNLQVWPVYYNTISVKNKDVYCWAISPIKFDTYHNVWWQGLEDNEQIKFDFKAVFKGYSDNGAQNYVRETNEAAVIDEAHKYTPQLNEIYTNIMLFDSYYLSESKPRIVVNKADVEAYYDSTTQTYKTNNLSFELGSGTFNTYGNYNLHFSVYNNAAYVYPDSESGVKVDGSKIECGDDKLISNIPLVKEKRMVTLNPTFEIKEGTPKGDDYLYYLIKIDCIPAGGETSVWTEYLFTSTHINEM